MDHSYAEKHLKFRLYDRSDSRSRDENIDTVINSIDNLPNPFNPITEISYQLMQDSNVRIVIYDIMGRNVKDLLDKRQYSGKRSVKWNAIDNYGQKVSAGLYFYTIEAGNSIKTGKMLLLK